MAVRRAALVDLPALVRVINRAYVVEASIFHGERTDADDVRARLALPNACFLAIDDAEGSAGSAGSAGVSAELARLAGAVYVEVRGERGYFAMLSVDPDRQRRGLGRVLVRAAEAHCRAAGCRYMDIDVVDLRAELPGFYAALGYTAVGAEPYPDRSRVRQDVKLIRMTRSLADT